MCHTSFKELLWITLLLLLFSSGLSLRHLFQSSSKGDAKGEFLADEIPLQILATVPASLIDTKVNEVEISGTQSITIVFSRPVISFGEDGSEIEDKDKIPFTLEPEVPGKYIWVTTYIIRWEPETEWSMDQEIIVNWNTDLITYDGVRLSYKSLSSITLMTPAFSMDIANVISNASQTYTNGLWDPFVGTSANFLPEVPPDGIIELHFSAPITYSIIQNNLQIMNIVKDTPTTIKLEISQCFFPEIPCLSCETEEDEFVLDEIYGTGYYNEEVEEEVSIDTAEEVTCVNITLIGDLTPDTKYAFVLDEGIEYNTNGGRINERLEAPFGSLRPLIIPFLDDKDIIIKSSYLNLWLPHGMTPIKEDDEFKNFPMKIVDVDTDTEYEFEFEQLNNATLRIYTSLIPGASYRMTVFSSKAYIDAYDQFLEGSSVGFKVEEIMPFFEAATVSFDVGMAIFEKGQKWGQKVLTFNKGDLVFDENLCKSGASLDIWGISDASSLLPVFYDNVYEKSMKEYLGSPDDSLEPLGKDLTGEVSEFEISKLLEDTGVVVHEYCRSDLYNTQIIVESDVQVVAIVTESKDRKNAIGIIWVTSMSSGKPVKKATVTAFHKTTPDLSAPKDYEKVGSGTTNNEGFAYVSLINTEGTIIISVEVEGKMTYVPNVEVQKVSSASLYDTIILDRLLVRPSETLYVKGYALEQSDDKLVPVSYKSAQLVISPPLSDVKEPEEVFKVEIDEKYGSYEAKIEVPVDANLGEYSIRFEGIDKEEVILGATEVFLVDVPSAPTVKLTLDTPSWAEPSSKIEIKAQAESFIGSSVSNSEIIVVWSIADEFRDPNDETLAGEFKIKTDSSGVAEGTIDLSVYQNSPSPGMILEGKVSWFSSTQEMIEKQFYVNLELANVKIDLIRSVETDIPEQQFSVQIKVSDLEGNEIKSIDTWIELKEYVPVTEKGFPVYKLDTASDDLPGKVFDSCSVEKSGDTCDFTVPDVGEYALEACISEKKYRVCKRIYFGKTQGAWNDEPLTTFIPVSFAEKYEGPYKVGDKADFEIENPYENAILLISTTSLDNAYAQLVSLDDFTRNTVPIEVPKMCANNCGVTMTMAIPRQTKGLATELKVPVSKLFDPTMPHIESYSTIFQLNQNKEMKMEVSFPDAKKESGISYTEPSKSTSVKVTFDNSASTEVTIVVVNKALLDLIPYELAELDEKFVIDLAISSVVKDTSKFLIAPKALESLIDNFNERREINPWFDAIKQLNPSEDTVTIDYTSDYYLEKFSQYITVVPNNDVSSNSTTNDDDVEVLNEVEYSSGDLRLDPDTVSTPFFITDTSSGSKMTQKFKAPETTGTYVVRAYGASSSGIFGSAEAEITVRQNLEVEPRLPKFVRATDEFSASVRINSVDKVKSSFSVSVSVSGPLSLESDNKVKFDLDSDNKAEVFFDFKANGIGDAKVDINVDNGSGTVIKEKITIPILATQNPVTLSSAFVAKSTTSTVYQDGINLPSALAGSGKLVVAAGMRKEPGIASLALDLLEMNVDYECPLYADLLLASVAIPATLDQYDPWDPDPNLIDKRYVTLTNSIYPNYTKAIKELDKTYTSEVFGLEPVQLCSGQVATEEQTVDIEQNAKGVWIIDQVKEALKETRIKDIKNEADSVIALRDLWYDVLATAVVEEASKLRENDTMIDIDTVAMVRAALGGTWTAPKGTSSKVIDDLSMDRLSDEFGKMKLESQAWYILALLSTKNGIKAKDVSTALKSWESLLLDYSNNAFIADAPGSKTPASNLGNGLAALVMTRTESKNKKLQNLIGYAAGPVMDELGFKQFSIFEKTLAAIVLSEYDIYFKTKDPNVRLSIRSGSISLLSYVFNDPTRPVSIQETDLDLLDSPPKPIDFTAVGMQEAFVSVSVYYVPKKSNPLPLYGGIFVERSLQLESSEEENSSILEVVPVESIVYLKVQFMTPRNLGETVVEVLLPAGLDPIDIVSDISPDCPVPYFNLLSDVYDECPDQQILNSEVKFTYKNVTVGTHGITIKAVAATSGIFMFPSTRVYVTENTNIMGVSGSGTLEICSEKSCTVKTGEREFIPTACPLECSNNGVCDLSKGVCSCFEGFKGSDCAKIT